MKNRDYIVIGSGQQERSSYDHRSPSGESSRSDNFQTGENQQSDSSGEEQTAGALTPIAAQVANGLDMLFNEDTGLMNTGDPLVSLQKIENLSFVTDKALIKLFFNESSGYGAVQQINTFVSKSDNIRRTYGAKNAKTLTKISTLMARLFGSLASNFYKFYSKGFDIPAAAILSLVTDVGDPKFIEMYKVLEPELKELDTFEQYVLLTGSRIKNSSAALQHAKEILIVRGVEESVIEVLSEELFKKMK